MKFRVAINVTLRDRLDINITHFLHNQTLLRKRKLDALIVSTYVAMVKRMFSSGSTPSIHLSLYLSVHAQHIWGTCLVRVNSNSKGLHSFIGKLFKMIAHALKMFTSYYMHIS